MRIARARLSLTLLFAATCLSAPAGAQSSTAMANTPVTSPLLRTSGTFFALSVADIEASTAWYREKLGLTVTMQHRRTDETKAAATVLQGGGLTVELVQHDEAKPVAGAVPPGRGALYLHGIFKVGATIDDFDATVATLRARGVDIAMGPWARNGDQPANVIIRDNAGNYIQLFGK